LCEGPTVNIEHRPCRKPTGHLGGFLVAIAVAAGAVGHASPAAAATITVTTVVDGAVTDGNCTLREAVLAANSDTARDACPAGSGADLIVLPAGTYTLSVAGANEDAALTGDLDVTSAITLRGDAAGTTIVRAGAISDRVLHVLSTGTASIEQVTIRDGVMRFGGGVFNA